MTRTSPTPRGLSRGVRRGGGAVLAAALVGTALFAPLAATAAPDESGRDADRITAPAGLFVDVGSCTSSVQCASIPGGIERNIDLTTLPDWKSSVNEDFETFIPDGAAGQILVVRNDSDQPIRVGNAGGTLLNADTGEENRVVSVSPWPTLQPGEFAAISINAPSYFSSIVDEQGGYGDFDKPTSYVLDVTTDQGPVAIEWTGTPTGSWNTAIVDPILTTDQNTCTDEVGTGTLSFTADIRASDLAVAWADSLRAIIAADPTSPDIQRPGLSIMAGLGGMVAIQPASNQLAPEGDLTGWYDQKISQVLFEHLESITRSHPEWMTAADPIAFPGTGISFSITNMMDVTGPWADTGVTPSIQLKFTDIPVTWDAPLSADAKTIDLTGESINGFSGSSFATTTADVLPNPCYVPPTEEPSIRVVKDDDQEDIKDEEFSPDNPADYTSSSVVSSNHPATDLFVTITNNGDEALTDFVFEDTTEAGPEAVWNTDDLAALQDLTLEPGDTFTVRGTITLVYENGKAETHTDTAIVSATGVISGTPVSDDDAHKVDWKAELPHSDIDVSKNAEGDDSQTVAPGTHDVVVTIENDGVDPLTDFVFTDTTESGNDVVWSEEDLAALAELTLDPGETFTVHGTVLIEDGTHRDNVTVGATGTLTGTPVEDEDPTTYVPEEPEPTPTPTPTPETPEPGIDVSKNDEGDDSQVVKAGEHEVTVTIVNTGDEDLTDFTFEDTTESGNDVVWSAEDLAALADLTLAPGDSFVVTGTVLVEDGTHRDEVTIDASGVISGTPVSDEDPTEYVPEKPETPVTPTPEPEEPVVPTPEPTGEPEEPTTPTPEPEEPTTPVTPSPEPEEPEIPVVPTPEPEEPETPVTPTPEPEEPIVPTPKPTDEPQEPTSPETEEPVVPTEPTTPTPAPEKPVTPTAPEGTEKPSLSATGNDGAAALPITAGAGILLLAGATALVIARRRTAARANNQS